MVHDIGRSLNFRVLKFRKTLRILPHATYIKDNRKPSYLTTPWTVCQATLSILSIPSVDKNTIGQIFAANSAKFNFRS